MAKGSGFDPVRDSHIRVDLMKVAKSLDQEVEMSESELRELMKKLFSDVPSH